MSTAGNINRPIAQENLGYDDDIDDCYDNINILENEGAMEIDSEQELLENDDIT